jgi:hypothetical protein
MAEGIDIWMLLSDVLWIEIMKRNLLLFLVILLPGLVEARAFRILDMKTLVAESQIVFVGRVEAIEPTGMGTSLSYPTVREIEFTWLNMKTEVVEPIKGVKKGESIQTAILSVDRDKTPHQILINGPGMIEPQTNGLYLLCLLPTTQTNLFAALTAPYDDNQAIFILDRNFWLYGFYSKRRQSGTLLPNEYDTRYDTVWSLIDEAGKLLPDGAEQMRRTFAAEITTPTKTNAVIHLQWETHTSPSGWQWDVPKGQTAPTAPAGPITMPSMETNQGKE